ncbi:MAG: cation transporter [Crocinitomicaceae bacterium]|nr:cation transporter [Crocinitomicaceae bacterium]
MKTHKQTATQTALLSMFSNAGLAVTKGITGFFGHSDAMIADAIESTADVFASLLVLFGLNYSSKPADENHPYGHGKAEALVTFAVVGFLLISATIIAVESIRNLQQPQEKPEIFTLYVLGVIILIKEFSYRYVKKKSEETNSSSLHADAWHHRSDAISSVMAFVGISIALIFGKGYEKADDWAALLASVFIVYNAFLIFRPALGEIMDEHLHDHVIADIRRLSTNVNGVLDTEKCLVRKTGMVYIVDLHVEVDGILSVFDGHEISHRLKDYLMEQMPEIADVLIHIEPKRITV